MDSIEASYELVSYISMNPRLCMLIYLVCLGGMCCD